MFRLSPRVLVPGHEANLAIAELKARDSGLIPLSPPSSQSSFRDLSSGREHRMLLVLGPEEFWGRGF